MNHEILEKLNKQMETLFEAIDICINKNLILPSVMLIYAGIDIIGALERKQGEGTQKSFVRWVENYLLNQNLQETNCTAIELYGARCGVLHTMSPKSDLSIRGKAREICYAWGNATAKKLELTGVCLGLSYPVIHISELNSAFQKGVRCYLEELAREENRLSEINNNEKDIWFSDVPTEIVDYSFKILSGNKK